MPVADIEQITVAELDERLQQGVNLLDVRRQGEWDAGHIDGANWWPLDNFKVSPPEIDHDSLLAVHCKSGYRSIIACSLLERAGFHHLVNVAGGFDAWQQANLPIVSAINGR